MAEKRHIAEHTQDVIDMRRRVQDATARLQDDTLRNFIQLAASEQVDRATTALRDAWGALYRLETIATHAPQREES